MSNEQPAKAEVKSRSLDVLPQDPGMQILAAIQSIRYGSVEIVIHDGKVVQIERKEKVRLNH